MAIKFSVQGIEYTADTPAEAAELQKLLGRQASAQKAAVSRWKAPTGKPKAQKARKLPMNRVFWALYNAPNGHMSGAQIASTLGVKMTGVAPLFAHAYKWQRKASPEQPFEAFVRKDINASGDTIFILTDEGRTLVERLKEG